MPSSTRKVLAKFSPHSCLAILGIQPSRFFPLNRLTHFSSVFSSSPATATDATSRRHRVNAIIWRMMVSIMVRSSSLFYFLVCSVSVLRATERGNSYVGGSSHIRNVLFSWVHAGGHPRGVGRCVAAVPTPANPQPARNAIARSARCVCGYVGNPPHLFFLLLHG